MAAGDLTTLANVKQWLGLAATTDDALLSRMITAYSSQIQTWLNRVILKQAYTEVRDGTGRNVLVFADYPVSAVASVAVDGNAIPAGDFVVPGYRFDATRLFLNGYTFCRGLGNVQINYTAGYDTVPPELEEAVIQVIALRYREKDRIGLQSKTLAAETVSFFVKDYPDTVRTTLNNYRKVVPL